MLKPVFTEKSLREAKEGRYSFWIDVKETKSSVKSALLRIFGVHVTSIKTIKKAGEKGRNVRGKKFNKLSAKKAVVTIKDGEKLDVFAPEK